MKAYINAEEILFDGGEKNTNGMTPPFSVLYLSMEDDQTVTVRPYKLGIDTGHYHQISVPGKPKLSADTWDRVVREWVGFQVPFILDEFKRGWMVDSSIGKLHVNFPNASGVKIA